MPFGENKPLVLSYHKNKHGINSLSSWLVVTRATAVGSRLLLTATVLAVTVVATTFTVTAVTSSTTSALAAALLPGFVLGAFSLFRLRHFTFLLMFLLTDSRNKKSSLNNTGSITRHGLDCRNA